jgi:hypothetical protein
MIVYGDRRESLTPTQALARLAEAHARAVAVRWSADLAHGAANCASAERHDALIELLIEAGLLEQALADTLCPREDGELAVSMAVTRLTDLAAEAVARSCANPGSAAAPCSSGWWRGWSGEVAALLDHLAGAGLPLTMDAVLPEGYLFYALYPEAYLLRMRQALAARRVHGGAESRPYVIIGLRSIGTSLGAVAAAACREMGVPVRRFSVRPRGECFEREVRATPALIATLRDLGDHGARFVLVDEGPGLSGSSLAGAARFLCEEVAVSPERIAFLCANAWPGSAAPAWALRLWQAVSRWIVDADCAARRAALACGAWLGPATGQPVSTPVLADLSGGAWRRRVGLPSHVATSHPRFERCKYLFCDDPGRYVWAKFIGLGRHGRLKAAWAAHLAARGFVPHVVGYAHGFLLSQEVAAPPLWADSPGFTRGGRAAPGDLARIASYYAYMATTSRPGASSEATSQDDAMAPETFGRLCAMVAHNTRAWFGPTLDGEIAALARWQDAVLRTGRAGGDGKPQPHEWLSTTPLLKADAADHHLDHGPVWPIDPCYDLAGTISEWALDGVQSSFLVREYAARSTDHHVWERLPFYKTVYAAALLGQYDTAYHLETSGVPERQAPEPQLSPGPAACYDSARRRYAALLRDALVHSRRAARPAGGHFDWREDRAHQPLATGH